MTSPLPVHRLEFGVSTSLVIEPPGRDPKVVARLNELRVLVDVSRCSEQVGWDAPHSRLMKNGCAEGHSSFAGSLRVSLRYKFFPLSAQEGSQGIVEGVFQHPDRTYTFRWAKVEPSAAIPA